MKSIEVLLFILVLIGITLIFIEVFPTHQAYTYEVVSASDYKIVDTLNTYGAKGCIIDSARRALEGTGYSQTASYEILVRCPK